MKMDAADAAAAAAAAAAAILFKAEDVGFRAYCYLRGRGACM